MVDKYGASSHFQRWEVRWEERLSRNPCVLSYMDPDPARAVNKAMEVVLDDRAVGDVAVVGIYQVEQVKHTFDKEKVSEYFKELAEK